MPKRAVVNFGKVEVSTGYDAAATSVALATGEGARLPDPAVVGPYNLVWWNATDYTDPADDPKREIVRYEAGSGDTLSSIVRGREDTAATTKNEAGKTYKMALAMTRDSYEHLGDVMPAWVDDGSGNVSPQPSDVTNINDPDWEIDDNGDVMPKPHPVLPPAGMTFTEFLLEQKARKPYANGTEQYSAGTQVVTHNLGRVPDLIEIRAIQTGVDHPTSLGSYTGGKYALTWHGEVTNAWTGGVRSDAIIYISFGSTTVRSAVISAVDEASFTLTWTNGNADTHFSFIVS